MKIIKTANYKKLANTHSRRVGELAIKMESIAERVYSKSFTSLKRVGFLLRTTEKADSKSLLGAMKDIEEILNLSKLNPETLQGGHIDIFTQLFTYLKTENTLNQNSEVDSLNEQWSQDPFEEE